MHNIQLICIGKLNAAYFKKAAEEYSKRLSAFCSFTITELSEEAIFEKNASDAVIEKALEKEGKAILQAVNKGAQIIALCIEGKQMASEELADYLSQSAVSGSGNIAFVIGSSHGLSPLVKGAAAKKLSMSKMTFPHQLARVMLLEQIYRAFCILNKNKYHK